MGKGVTSGINYREANNRVSSTALMYSVRTLSTVTGGIILFGY